MMFFENSHQPAQYKCKVTSRDNAFIHHNHQSNIQALNDYVALYSEGSDYHQQPQSNCYSSGEELLLSDQTITTTFVSASVTFEPPRPAPRKIYKNLDTAAGAQPSQTNKVEFSTKFSAPSSSSLAFAHQKRPTQSSLTRQQPILTLKNRSESNRFLMNNNQNIFKLPINSSLILGNKKLHHKFIDVSSTQTSRQMQVSEDTNDSCSDEDTEDSADNRQDKPKVR